MSALGIYDTGMKVAAVAVGAGAVILYLYENGPGGGSRVVHLPGTLQPGDIGARAELTCTNPCKGKVVLIDKRQNPPKDIGYLEAVLPPWYDFVIEAVLAMITAGTFIPLIVGYDIVVGFINNGVVQEAMKPEVAKLKLMVSRCNFDTPGEKYSPYQPDNIDTGGDKLVAWAKSQAIGLEPTIDSVSGEPTFKATHSKQDEVNTMNALHAKAIEYKSSQYAIGFATEIIKTTYESVRLQYGTWAAYYYQTQDQWARNDVLAGLKSGGDKAIEAVIKWDTWEKGNGQYFTTNYLKLADQTMGPENHLTSDADAFAWWLKENPISLTAILNYVKRYITTNKLNNQAPFLTTQRWTSVANLWTRQAGALGLGPYKNDDLWYTMAATFAQRMTHWGGLESKVKENTDKMSTAAQHLFYS